MIDDHEITMRLETHDNQQVAIVVHEGAGFVELFSHEGEPLPLEVVHAR